MEPHPHSLHTGKGITMKIWSNNETCMIELSRMEYLTIKMALAGAAREELHAGRPTLAEDNTKILHDMGEYAEVFK